MPSATEWFKHSLIFWNRVGWKYDHLFKQCWLKTSIHSTTVRSKRNIMLDFNRPTQLTSNMPVIKCYRVNGKYVCFRRSVWKWWFPSHTERNEDIITTLPQWVSWAKYNAFIDNDAPKSVVFRYRVVENCITWRSRMNQIIISRPVCQQIKVQSTKRSGCETNRR